MVLGKDNLGVEEIRGTGHPSWQVYNQARGATMAPGKEGEGGPGYAGAVEKWKTNLTNQAGETERERIKGEAAIEAARVHGAGNPYLASMAAKEDITNKAAERGRLGTEAEGFYKYRHGGSAPKKGEPAYAPFAASQTYYEEHPEIGEKGWSQRYDDEVSLQNNEHLFTPENLTKTNIQPPPPGATDEQIRNWKLTMVPKILAAAASATPASTPTMATDPAWTGVKKMWGPGGTLDTAVGEGQAWLNKQARNVIPGGSLLWTPEGAGRPLYGPGSALVPPNETPAQ